MEKSRFIELSLEIKKIEKLFDILDPSNPIEFKEISLLKQRLEKIISELDTNIELSENQKKLFKIV